MVSHSPGILTDRCRLRPRGMRFTVSLCRYRQRGIPGRDARTTWRGRPRLPPLTAWSAGKMNDQTDPPSQQFPKFHLPLMMYKTPKTHARTPGYRFPQPVHVENPPVHDEQAPETRSRCRGRRFPQAVHDEQALETRSRTPGHRFPQPVRVENPPVHDDQAPETRSRTPGHWFFLPPQHEPVTLRDVANAMRRTSPPGREAVPP